MPEDNLTSGLRISEARALVKDLFTPRPLIYWADFILHVTLGWAAFAVAVVSPGLSVVQTLALLVAALALYRAAIFIHELAHLKRGTFGVFRWVWNLSCGFPLMIPSFTYRGVHNDHHKRAVYGTTEDGEYLPFAVQSPWHIVLYLLFSFAAPLLLAGRFVVLTPLSWLHPRWRRWVWEHASSLTIDLRYCRPAASAKDETNWKLQEAFTAGYGITAITLAASGIIPVRVLGIWYLLELSVFLLNSVRTLAAHRYRNPGTHSMAFADQFLDSVNVTGHRLITPLWAPVGLRFHATHHLFPAIPYHALGEAHRRLATQLSDSSVYLSTTHNSLCSALRQLWQESRRNQAV